MLAFHMMYHRCRILYQI